MIETIQKYILRFIILIFIQIYLFNNIRLSGYINPNIYILFLLLLPFETPGWLLLISGFLLGMTVDIFMDTIGVHTIACVTLAVFRPLILKIISPREGYESGTNPRILYYGFIWFLKYAAVLILIHHLVLFYTETFQLGNFFITFLRVILSSFITLILIILSQYFVFRK